MKITIPALMGLLIIVAIMSAGCVGNMGFNFYIEETHEPINGDVYLGDKYLGSTQNGRLDVDIDELYPGEISIKGTYKNEPFVFYFDFYEDGLEYAEMDFVIPLEDLENLSFNAADVNTEEIEDAILELINSERRKRGITELKRNSILDEVAKEHSNDMIERDYYAHTSPEGYDLYDRLQSKNIFYFTATENMYYMSYLTPDTNIAEETVFGWIESPSNKISVLDTDDPLIWDNVGIGVSCVDEIDEDGAEYPAFYVTAVFVGFESIYEDELSKEYLQYIDLYDPGLGLDYNTKLEIDFTSDHKVNVYIVPDESEYDKLLHRKSFDTIVTKRSVQQYSDTIEIKPGYGIIIDASTSSFDVEYILSLKYNP